MSLQDKKAPKEKEKEKEEEKEPENIEDKFEKLQKEFHEYKTTKERESQHIQFNKKLDAQAEEFDLIKENPKWKQQIKRNTLAIMTQNPRIELKEAMTAAVQEKMDDMKEFEEKIKNQKHANTKISAILNQTQTGGGGVPNLSTEKPYTASQVRSGQSRKDLQEFLASME